jgi:hypothetical protein
VSNGYHEGLACEKRIGTQHVPCTDPAAFVVHGLALCEAHFEDLIQVVSREFGWQQGADARFAAKAVK